MSNISSIRLSGYTYQIRDNSATTVVELTQSEYDQLPMSAKTANILYSISDASGGDLSQYWTSAQTQSAITQATSGLAESSAVTEEISAATSGKVDTTTFETYSGNVETALSGKQDTLIVGDNITISGNVISATGGKAVSGGTNISITTGETADTINCTIPLSGVGMNSLFLTNANNTIPTSNNYGDLILGTFCTIEEAATSYGDNKIIGGTSSIKAGQGNINIGYTNNIGLTAREKSLNNYVFGNNNTITPGIGNDKKTSYNIIIGRNNIINTKSYCSLFGYQLYVSNNDEISIGKLNSSVSDGTESGNTYFSVGNGTADNARHNAFEIRQNGDIYITSGGTDILLQDHLGGGGSITIDPSLDSGSTNAVANSAITAAIDAKQDTLSAGTNITISGNVISAQLEGGSVSRGDVEDMIASATSAMVDTSAITTSVTIASTDSQVPSAKAVYDQLGGMKIVKLTESEYTALVSKDSNTLYVVIPDSSN